MSPQWVVTECGVGALNTMYHLGGWSPSALQFLFIIFVLFYLRQCVVIVFWASSCSRLYFYARKSSRLALIAVVCATSIAFHAYVVFRSRVVLLFKLMLFFQGHYLPLWILEDQSYLVCALQFCRRSTVDKVRCTSPPSTLVIHDLYICRVLGAGYSRH